MVDFARASLLTRYAMNSPVRTDPSYRFGLFEVFPESGRLFRQGQRVKLQEQPFKLLLLLVEKPGEIVSARSGC